VIQPSTKQYLSSISSCIWEASYSATLPKCDKQQNRDQTNLNPDLEELCVLQYPSYGSSILHGKYDPFFRDD